MASGAPTDPATRVSPSENPRALPRLFDRRVVALVWVPILVITVLHYATSPSHHWAHDILRRMYYFPIILSAFMGGLFGGLGAATLVFVLYLPHAFLLGARFDPAAGVEKWLEFLLYFIVGGVSGYLSDLERKRTRQLEAALSEQQSLTGQLVRAGRLSALGEVVAGVAHEVKNPLHVLKQTAEIIDPLIPAHAEERRMWEIHVEEIGRLGRTADRFLSFARPPSFVLEPLDLREVATRLLELVGAEARQRQVDLTTDLPEDPVLVRGDRDHLAQVGLNIVLNALTAMKEVREPKEGCLHIRVGTTSDRGRTPMHFLRIENNGDKIPEEDLERIFDPFHGIDPQGTGLGLAISARIIEIHGGYIEAANEGLGVAFTVLLPPVDSDGSSGSKKEKSP